MKKREFFPATLGQQIPNEKYRLSEAVREGSSEALADGTIDSTFNTSVTDGDGYVTETVVQPDGKIIAVGTFVRANGVKSGNIARFNADGTLDTNFNAGGNGASNIIQAVALQSDGKILIGGDFFFYNSQAITRLARLNTDGSLDTTFLHNLNFSATINELAVQPDGKIIVGGTFNASNGSPLAGRITRLNSDGTTDSTFMTGTRANGIVRKVVYTTDGKILIGGSFSTYSSQIARGVARLNNDGTLDASFNPGTGGDGTILNIAVQPDGKILVSGEITRFNGTLTDGLVRLTSTGTIDTAFNFSDDPNIGYLGIAGISIQPDGKILAGYILGVDVATYTGGVLRFNSDGTKDTNFSFGDTEAFVVRDINLLPDGRFLTGGQFISYQNQIHLRLARVNSDGSVDNSFNPSIATAGLVYAIERQPDGKTIIAGDFEFVNGLRRSKIARLNADGSLDDTFNIGTGFYLGTVFTLAIKPDGKIIAGGSFVSYNSNISISLIEINPDGSFNQDFDFNQVITLAVLDLALQPDSKIIVGGQIFNQSLQPVNVARYNTDGTADLTFNAPQMSSGFVNALLIQPSGKIVIGGTFISNGNFNRTNIARLNSNGSLDSGFSTSSGVGIVNTLKQQPDGKVLAGGFGLTRYTSEGSVDLILTSGNGFFRAIEIQPDNKIILGGSFITYNGSTVNGIVRLNSDGTIDPAFNTGSGVSGSVLALAQQPDGRVLVGGQYVSFNGLEKSSLVRLQNTSSRNAAFCDFDGDGKTDISIFRPSDGSWWYSRSSDNQFRVFGFGTSTDRLVPGDFTGDGKTDIAVFRPSSGEWFIQRSEDNSFFSFPFGASGDIPVASDFDGDGKADAGVFRPSNSTWFISKSSGGTLIVQFGASGDKPVPADYDGDGRADIAIFRPSDGSWWYVRSSDNQFRVYSFGTSTDKPVPGDYTGDGKADIAIFRPSTGEWYIQRSEDNSYFSFPFGGVGDIPAPGDYDGDGRFDPSVFRPSSSTWFINRTTAGLLITDFGTTGDQPVPNAFVP